MFSPSKSVFEIMRSTTLVELKQIVILSFLLLCDVNLVISRIRHQEELLGPLPSLELGTYNIKKSILLSVWTFDPQIETRIGKLWTWVQVWFNLFSIAWISSHFFEFEFHWSSNLRFRKTSSSNIINFSSLSLGLMLNLWSLAPGISRILSFMEFELP